MNADDQHPVHADEGDRPWERSGCVRRDCEPHRGPLLEGLGIIGVVFGVLASPILCWPAGLVALPVGVGVWAAARRDLRLIRGGVMDPAGRARVDLARQFGQLAVLLAAACGLGYGVLHLTLYLTGWQIPTE
jgi:hypothetical protein